MCIRDRDKALAFYDTIDIIEQRVAALAELAKRSLSDESFSREQLKDALVKLGAR